MVTSCSQAHTTSKVGRRNSNYTVSPLSLSAKPLLIPHSLLHSLPLTAHCYSWYPILPFCTVYLRYSTLNCCPCLVLISPGTGWFYSSVAYPCLPVWKPRSRWLHLCTFFSAEASCNFVSAPFQVGFQAEWTLIPPWATSDSESCTSSLLVFLVTSLSLLKFREKSHLWT